MKTILKNEKEIAVVLTKEELQTLIAACVDAWLHYNRKEDTSEFLKGIMKERYDQMQKKLENI